MTGQLRLDQKLLSKVAGRLGKSTKYARELVSKRATRLGISSEASLVILAKQNGVGASVYQRKLGPTKQAEIREALSNTPVGSVKSSAMPRPPDRISPSSPTSKQLWRATIEFLIQDTELRERCADILMASSKFDRPINQATLVLEDRIRRKAEIGKPLVGEGLVNAAFKENVGETVLLIASKDPEDQRGYTQILRGLVPAFRNKTHHHVINKFSREEAMRVCGFIDVLLRVVDGATKEK